MLPIQQFFSEKINTCSFSKNKIARNVFKTNKEESLKRLNEFFYVSEPDYTTAQKLAELFQLTDEEFEELWYQTKDQTIRRKMKARIQSRKAALDKIKAA